jgi:hypothetical protein
MHTAIEEVVFEKYQFPRSWMDVQRKHQLLYRDEVRDLQFE